MMNLDAAFRGVAFTDNKGKTCSFLRRKTGVDHIGDSACWKNPQRSGLGRTAPREAGFSA